MCYCQDVAIVHLCRERWMQSVHCTNTTTHLATTEKKGDPNPTVSDPKATLGEQIRLNANVSLVLVCVVVLDQKLNHLQFLFLEIHANILFQFIPKFKIYQVFLCVNYRNRILHPFVAFSLSTLLHLWTLRSAASSDMILLLFRGKPIAPTVCNSRLCALWERQRVTEVQ